MSLRRLASDRKRLAALILLLLWAAAVAYLTLTPTGYAIRFQWRRFVCLACTDRGVSDIVRNWILFIPGGLLAAVLIRPLPAAVLGLAATALIEAAQTQIPGRYPALQDLIFNALGAVTGVLVLRHGLPRAAQRLLAAAAVGAWLAPLVLLVPRTTQHDLFGQWTPEFRRAARYEGQVLSAAVGDQRIPPWQVEEKPPLDIAIVERRPIRLRLEAGPLPASRAPIFQITDREQRGIVELHALGPDLILRGWSSARVLKLDQPDVRWVGAMDGVAVGDTVTLVIERSRDSVCMSVAGRERCGLAPSLADGWGHVLHLEGPPAWFRSLLSLMWAAGLGGLIGLASGSRRSALAVAIGVALAGYVASHISPDVRPSILHATTLVVGAVLGAFLRPYVIGLWTELRPSRSA